MADEEKKVTVDGQEMTLAQLEEKKKSLSPNERLVESAPGVYQILTRMNG